MTPGELHSRVASCVRRKASLAEAVGDGLLARARDRRAGVCRGRAGACAHNRAARRPARPGLLEHRAHGAGGRSHACAACARLLVTLHL